MNPPLPIPALLTLTSGVGRIFFGLFEVMNTDQQRVVHEIGSNQKLSGLERGKRGMDENGQEFDNR